MSNGNNSVEYGWNLFSSETTKTERRRYWIHVLIYVVALLPTIWPVITPFNQIEPYIFGMPFNMAITVLAVVVVFFNTVSLYRFEHGSLME